jgi:hypothetical protein
MHASPATRVAWAVVLGATLWLPVSARAQAQPATAVTPNSQSTIWLAASIGGGAARLACDICEPARELGPAVDLSFGSHATPHLRVGIEAGGWTHDDDGSRESGYRAGVIAALRPDLSRGVYLHGGFGWQRYQAGDFHYDAPRLSLGLGWDHLLGDHLRVGNQLTVDASSFGTLRRDDTSVARNVGLSLVRLSVQLLRP